jgi:hypothetical protein
MFEKRRAILAHLLKRRFEMEAQSWKNAINQNFDVAILCRSIELQELVLEYLESQRTLSARLQPIPHPAEAHVEHQTRVNHPEHQPQQSTKQQRRTIYVTSQPSLRGCAAVVFELHPLESLLPSAATMITMILEAVGLERFLDAFDSQKLSQLKRVIEMRGIDDFFDAVIQVAYIVGFRGDDQQASAYLESVLSKGWNSMRESPDKPEKHSTSLEKLFEQLIELQDPHDTLKAALAHYVFHRRRVTQAEASRILKVSRSTLQSHLQLAERLKVATYFGPPRAHA